MNPTVSVRSAFFPLGRMSSRVVGSSVAKSLSSTRTPAEVSAFMSVDFPALVYPTSATTGISFFRRCFPCVARSRPTSSILSVRRWIFSRMRRRSTSSCCSPGPRVPIPPSWRERCVHARVRRGSM